MQYILRGRPARNPTGSPIIRLSGMLELCKGAHKKLHTYSCFLQQVEHIHMAGKAGFKQFLEVFAGLLGCCIFVNAMAAPAVPVDWREQVIYFVMLDRFADGDPSNNDQGAGEFDPADGRKFSGGDLDGVRAQLPYIRGLGATAVWVTPPVRNQWWNIPGQFGGYHGYWGIDFKKVDPHFGTLQSYRALAKDLHAKGMFLVQDIVVNHTANFTDRDASGRWVRVKDSEGLDRPLQKPFDNNLSPDVFHFDDNITDFTDTSKLWTGQLANLDDLNTSSETVRRALRDSYGYWMREVGVDAFRIDTAFYVPPDYFRDFLWSRDKQAPGVMHVAKELGKPNFLSFGEGFAIDKPFEVSQDARIKEYMGSDLLPSMINFTYYGTSLDVFARGAATSAFTHRLKSQVETFGDVSLMPTFIDNHDVERFLSQSNEASMRQALLAMFTVPGIPVIYYGTEQGFTSQRASMFASGYGSGGRDHFDASSPLYRYIASLAAFRKSNRSLTHGAFTRVMDDASGPGLLAWRMHVDGSPDALVVMNTADTPRLISDVVMREVMSQWSPALGTPSGAQYKDGAVVDGKASWVFVEQKPSVRALAASHSGLRFNPVDAAKPWQGVVTVSGSGPATHVVIDGKVDEAIAVKRDGDRWTATVDTSSMTDANLEHRIVAWNRDKATVSGSRRFVAQNNWQPLASVSDQLDDDKGPTGRYTYPAGADWKDVRAGDIKGVNVLHAGNRLRVEVDMREISTAWNPSNGFDHVSLQLYLDVPGIASARSASSMEQRGALPDGMQWNRMLRIHGWSNGLYSVDDSGAFVGLSETAKISVDRVRSRITMDFSASSLGLPSSLDGVKLWLNTWDFDGGLRPLTPVATPGSFGGGQSDADPLWLDSVGPVLINVPKQPSYTPAQ